MGARVLLTLAVLLGTARAGRGEDAIAFPFESKAPGPRGEALRLAFSPAAGDTYEEDVTESGKVTVPGAGGDRVSDVRSSMTVVHQCQEVRQEGTRVMTSRLEKYGKGGAKNPNEVAEMRKVTLTWEADATGAVRRRAGEGGTAEARASVEQAVFAPGNRAFLAFPPAGVRAGQALDYVGMFDASDVRTSLLSPELPFEPEAKSEAFLVRTSSVAGEPAAEFAVNAVLYGAADLPTGGRMEAAARYTGSAVVSTKTGMPIGRMEMRIEARVSVLRDGERVTMTRDVTRTSEFRRRAESDAPSRRASPKDKSHAETQMHNFGMAIEMYFVTNRKLPSTLEELTDEDPKTGDKWLEKIPRDPWGNDYVYKVLDGKRFTILSLGPDGKDGTADDLRWPKTD